MNPEIAKLEEFLIDRATGDLGVDQQAQLEALLRQHPEYDREDFDLVAGEIAASLSEGTLDAVPPALAGVVVSRGEAMVRGDEQADPALVESPDRPQPRLGAEPYPARRPARLLAWSGWVAAAAAVVIWFAVPRIGEPSVPGLSQIRDSLIAGEAAVLAWSATEDPAAVGATGDVVWDAAGQTGIMRFAGLEANDPRQVQYQLWIFDSTRDERYPVDGGVFDIPTGATEVLVAIRPTIDVGNAALFAVTVEQPGGVVVSDRERIVLVAETG